MSSAASREAPGPSWLSTIFRMPAARRDLLEFLVSLAAEYGDVVRIPAAPREQYVLIRRPDHIRHVAQQSYENYSRRTRAYDWIRAVEGSGLPRIDGAEWRKRRRLEQPLFRHEQLVRFAEAMVRATSEMLGLWERRVGETVDVAREASALTLRIIGMTMFGAELAREAGRVYEILDFLQADIIRRMLDPVDLLVPAARRLPTRRNRAFRSARRELHEIVGRIAAQRRRDPAEDGTLMSLLTKTRDSGEPLDATQIRDEIIAFMIAGHETTATALTWCWYQLAAHPDVDDAIDEEARRVLGERNASAADCAALPLARAVFLEAMRIIPPVWLKVNRCEADDKLGDYRVRAGDTIVISPYLTHRLPEFWPRAEEFDPARFLPGAPPPAPFSFLPFGGGPHVCIGKDFATMEGQLIVAMVARRFRLTLTARGRPEIEPHITLRPRGGMPVVLTRRGRGAPAAAIGSA